MAEEGTTGVEERIKKIAEARDAAKAEAAELKARLATLEGELAPLKALGTKYETERTGWARERAFLAAGVTDPEAQEIAALFHGRIPEAERPALDAWLGSIKADPSKAPKALQPYLAPPAPPAPQGGQAPPPPPTQGAPPTVVRPTETTPSAGLVVSADAISAAAAKALRTGDWKEYDALKASVESEYAAKR